MNHKLLTKLALDGIKSNKKTIFSYVCVSSITVMIFYIMVSVAWSKYLLVDGKPLFYGAGELSLILRLGSFVVALIAVIFLMYGNKFVMRSRQKEMGLYGVLGLSKKNLSWILMIDSLVQAGAVLAIGLVCGTFLNKLMLLLLYKAVKQPPVNGLLFSWRAFFFSIILFGIAFFICFIKNLLSVQLGNPITLLRSENMGEKEPKVKYLSLIAGAVSLAVGYYIALTSKGAFSAIEMIFISILFVMCATYWLFEAGSIFILKVLKKNSRFYYKTSNFFSVSNLMFRMKHNATGLASICILSTGVILLMVCALSLMMLGEQNLNMMYPTDIMTHSLKGYDDDSEAFRADIEGSVRKSDADIAEIVYRQYSSTTATVNDGRLDTIDLGSIDFTKMENIYFLSLDDYNAYTGSSESLSPGEILCYSNGVSRNEGETVSIFGKDLRIKKMIGTDELYYIFDSTMTLFSKEIIVLSDTETMREMSHLGSPEDENNDKMYVFTGVEFNTKPTDAQIRSIEEGLTAQLGENTSVSYKEESRQFFYSLYGGAFFVGVFLAILFLVITVVIIYYKQLSEGFEDQKRFSILKNAGMTETEVKQTIQRQIMILFFLPVCTAIIHMMVASKIVKQFLQFLVYVDMPTFIISISIVCLIFFIVYALVYKLTSKQYMEIVYRK